jgi:hypothetical protein
VGSAVGSAVGVAVGVAVGSRVGSGTGSVIGSGVGSNTCKNLFIKPQKLSHQLFQSKTNDAAVCFAASFVFTSAEGSAVVIEFDSDSTQVPLTIWASVQFSAWAETGELASEIIVRRLPTMNACFGLNISLSYY